MKLVGLKTRRTIASALFIACLFIVPLSLDAQQGALAGTVTGTVLDQAQKVLPSAVVTLRNEATGKVVTTNTDSEGHFSTGGIPAGTYTVEVSAPGFAVSKRTGFVVSGSGSQDASTTLAVANLSQAVTVEGNINSLASQAAPSQNSLEAASAKSEISQVFIDNFISPVSDFSEVILMSPGTFSVNTNGVGLGQAKDYFRGFSDGQYTITYDGIPFEDTNSPTHHSWAFFPAQWIGGTDFDRSPGAASDIGPTNFGGSINLQSRDVPSDMNFMATASYGSFNTRFLSLDFDSGHFGKSSFLGNVQQLLSDGYQTNNKQKRDGGSLKYQYKMSDKTVITLFSGVMDLWNNTPNQNGPTRAQVAQYGDNFLLSSDPNSPIFWAFNYYHIQTDFEYAGINTDLGHGWRLDNKFYTYRYWNKQNYNSLTAISKTSAVDKLNGYRKAGDTLSISQDTRYGTLRIGAWYEWSYTDRYQIPTSPITGVNAVLPNFHEKFITQAIQPFFDYQYHVTRRLTVRAGMKPAYYNIALNQFADNGKTVGSLGGVAFVRHQAGYTSYLPAASIRYRLRDNWSAYFQYAKGSIIPPSSVFDVTNALVAVLPKQSLTNTFQGGTVYKHNRFTLDVDAYWIKYQNSYTSTIDPVTKESVYYLSGSSKTKGAEMESNIFLFKGLNLYLNGTIGQAKYVSTGLYVANAPKNTETVGLTYQRKSWDIGFFNKRIGNMWNDNGGINQAVEISPFNITNFFLNYMVKESRLRGTKFRFGINNLFDQHNIVGVTPASSSSNLPAPGDTLLLLPGRSFSVTMTAGYAPRK